MQPSLEQLRHLVALAETRNFTRAAESCHITQPPFSRSIRRLEELVGVQLVLRDYNKTIRFTDSGTRFVEHANSILHAVDLAVNEARSTSREDTYVRLGILEYVYHLMAPVSLKAFPCHSTAPKFEILDRPGKFLKDSVLTGDIDLAFMATSDERNVSQRLCSMPIFSERLALVTTNSHKLANEKNVELSDLDGEHLILFRKETAPTIFESIFSSLHETGTSNSGVTEVGLLQTMLNGVLSTNGIGVAPLSVAKGCPKGICVIPFAGRYAPAVTLLLVWLRDDPVYAEFGHWVSNVIQNNQFGKDGI